MKTYTQYFVITYKKSEEGYIYIYIYIYICVCVHIYKIKLLCYTPETNTIL